MLDSAADLLQKAQSLVPDGTFESRGFLETGLNLLVEDLNTQSHLTKTGERYFQGFLLRLLNNHLQLQRDYQRHPEIAQVPLHKPLIVVGLFRSGTTFLHNLLAEDPASRWLRVAEALFPTPAPQPNAWACDPRIANATEHIRLQDALAPNFSAAHHIDVLRPAECSRLFEHDLIGHLFDFRAQVPHYSQWLLEQDLRAAYQSYRRQLQYLSWQWPGSHWVLKAPAHLFALDKLIEVFPDAAIVYLHRNPLQVLPSCCSLSKIGRSRFSDSVDEAQIGQHWLTVLAEAVQRSLRVREQLSHQSPQHPGPIYDVSYPALLQDPMGTIQGIYDYFGYPFKADFSDRLTRWIHQNPQHKHGVHRYTLEQFGLTPEQIQTQFQDYSDRFSDYW